MNGTCSVEDATDEDNDDNNSDALEVVSGSSGIHPRFTKPEYIELAAFSDSIYERGGEKRLKSVMITGAVLVALMDSVQRKHSVSQ